jgi:hypothetical protein
MKIKTKDIWLGCFCLSKGAELEEVRLDNNNSNSHHNKEVLFIFSGQDVQELQREFLSGQAMCNVTRLRASMLHLKEQMYELIRA